MQKGYFTTVGRGEAAEVKVVLVLGDFSILEHGGAFGFHHDIVCKEVPEVQADFEQFILWNVTQLKKVLQTSMGAIDKHGCFSWHPLYIGSIGQLFN